MKVFVVNTWYGVFLPAGTAPANVRKLHADLAKVIRLPDLKERFAAEGGKIVGSTPEQFAAFIAHHIEVWKAVARDSKATID